MTIGYMWLNSSIRFTYSFTIDIFLFTIEISDFVHLFNLKWILHCHNWYWKLKKIALNHNEEQHWPLFFFFSGLLFLFKRTFLFSFSLSSSVSLSLPSLSFGSGKISAYLDNNPSNFFFLNWKQHSNEKLSTFLFNRQFTPWWDMLSLIFLWHSSI